MADNFVALEITTDGSELTDGAITTLQETWDGWEPNDGDLEVVLLETIGDMAGDLATDAARMPSEAFIEYGLTLLGVPYDSGLPATSTILITAVDNAGYTLEAGFEIDVDGFSFQTLTDAVIAPGNTTLGGVNIVASESGTEYNDLPGSLVNALTSSVAVDSIILEAPTSGGTDGESNEEFLNKISGELVLRGRTLVTWKDYERFAEDFDTINRAIAVGNTARQVRVVLIGQDGLAVDSGTKADLAALYTEFQQVNTVYTIGDAAYWTISAAVEVHPYPGYDPTDLAARVAAALASFFAPLTWGQPKAGVEVATQNELIVRRNKVIDVIGDVEGVDYVTTLILTTATTKAVTAAASTDLFTLANHGLQGGMVVKFTGLTGGTGITSGTSYYVIGSGLTTNTFKVSATPGGAALDVTSDLTAGTMTPVVAGQTTASQGEGDLAMPGAISLPLPGTFSVTVV